MDFEEVDSSEETAVLDSLRIQYEISNHCIQGDIQALNKDYNQALADYGRALEMQPENQDLHAQYRNLQLKANNQLIREYMARNRGRNDLIKHFTQRLRYQPDDAESQFKIGAVYQQEGWNDAALAQYKLALRLAPDNPFIRHNMALLYDQMGQTRKAQKELERVIELDSTLVPPFIHLGIIYKKTGNPEMARKMLLKALALDPTNVIAKEQLAGIK